MRRNIFSLVFLDPAQTILPHGSMAPAQTDCFEANVAEVLWAAGSRWGGLMLPYPLSSSSRLTRGESVDCFGGHQKALSDDEDLV